MASGPTAPKKDASNPRWFEASTLGRAELRGDRHPLPLAYTAQMHRPFQAISARHRAWRVAGRRVEDWRARMKVQQVKINRDNPQVPPTRNRSASSVNRDMSSLRAALNRVHDAGHVTTDMAWRVALRPAKNADGRRNVCLDRTRRRQLIAKAPSDLALFLHGMSVLPLRPGALAALTAAGFDERLATLFVGKDKVGQDRSIKLPPVTATFLAQQCKDKLKGAPMFSRADGSAWNKDAWKKPVKAAALAAELPEVTTAYAFRHSTTTDLVTGGLDLLTVAQLSGTSVAMIEKHYGHLRADHAAAALARLVL